MKEFRKFKKGEFITNTNKPGSFAIFEGIEVESYSTMKKFSAIAAYDPNKYRELPNGAGWATQPFLDVATKTKRCDTTVDGDTTSYWWRPCSEKEIEKAIDILHGYGYYWNEDLLSIIDKETGEVIRTVVEPKLEYHGEVVKPISQKFKELLSKVCHGIIEKKYSYKTSYYGGCYGFWDEEYWD
jgi:hypothetical protein